MGLSLLSLGLSTKSQNSAVSMSAILTFLIIYQATQGSYFWSYTASVANETANSLASIVLWASVLFMATFAHLIFNTLGTSNTFFLFAFLCCLGAVIFFFILKEIKGLLKEE